MVAAWMSGAIDRGDLTLCPGTAVVLAMLAMGFLPVLALGNIESGSIGAELENLYDKQPIVIIMNVVITVSVIFTYPVQVCCCRCGVARRGAALSTAEVSDEAAVCCRDSVLPRDRGDRDHPGAAARLPNRWCQQ